MSSDLQGRNGVVFGVANKRSIAWSIAQGLHAAGMKLAITYQNERLEGEAFNDFVGRIGTARFEELVKDLALPPEFSLETMTQFIDWNRNEPFVVVRGEGECAV